MVLFSPDLVRRAEAYFGFFLEAPHAERLVWVLFWTTCLQLGLQFPYIVLVPGVRANLFSGTLCAVALVGAVLVKGPHGLDVRSREFQISLILTGLVALSCAFSSTPGASSARGFVIIASGLGGFWCARLLLAAESSRRMFRALCLLILGAIIVVSVGTDVREGMVHQALDTNPHPLANRILLLWFAPLSLLFGGGLVAWLWTAALLAGSYLVFYLSMLRSAMLIPLVLAAEAAIFRYLRMRYLVVLLVPAVAIIVWFFFHLPYEKMAREHEPTYYRAESYPFSLKVALKNPILGVGLRAPRDEYLEDYRIVYPYVTMEQFAGSVRRVTTSENVFLTFMAELGIPFVTLYSACIVVLLVRLIRAIRRSSGPQVIHPLALLMAISAGLIHYQVLDGLFHPQLNWFFHLLLGLIPSKQVARHGYRAEE